MSDKKAKPDRGLAFIYKNPSFRVSFLGFGGFCAI